MNQNRLIRGVLLLLLLFVILLPLPIFSQTSPSTLGCCRAPGHPGACGSKISLQECCGSDSDCARDYFSAGLDCSGVAACGDQLGCCVATCSIGSKSECSGNFIAGVKSCTDVDSCRTGCHVCVYEGSKKICRFGLKKESILWCDGLSGALSSFYNVDATSCVNNCDTIGGGFAYLYGTITSSKNAPLKGAVISVAGKQLVSGDAGAYEIANIPAGEHIVTVTLEGYKTKSQSVVLSAGERKTNFNFVLEQSDKGFIRGVVRNKENNAVLEGVTITIGSGTLSAQRKTGSDGSFSFEFIPLGSYSLTADLIGYVSYSTTITLSSSYNSKSVDIQLKPLARAYLSGVIKEKAGSVIGDAIVAVANFPPVHSDSSGNYRVDLFEGSYSISVSHPSYETRTVVAESFSAGQSKTINFELVKKQACADGTVLNSCSKTIAWQGHKCTIAGKDPVKDSSCPCNDGYMKQSNGYCVLSGNNCEADCSYINDNVCHRECDGISGCVFSDPKMISLCNNKALGTILDYGSDPSNPSLLKKIRCCSYIFVAGAQELCIDGSDNDGDGLVDCADLDCYDKPCSNSNPSLRCNAGECTAPLCSYQSCEQENSEICWCGSSRLSSVQTKFETANSPKKMFCYGSARTTFETSDSCKKAMQNECSASGGTCYPFGCSDNRLITKECGSSSLKCCPLGKGIILASDCCDIASQCPSGFLMPSGTSSSPSSNCDLFNPPKFGCYVKCGSVPVCEKNKLIGSNTVSECKCGDIVNVASNSNKYCCEVSGALTVMADPCVYDWGTVRGKVTAKSAGAVAGSVAGAGIPVANAKISAKSSAYSTSAYTDASGSYTLKLPASARGVSYELVASASGYNDSASRTISVYLNQAVVEDFELESLMLECRFPSPPQAVKNLTANHMRGVKGAKLSWKAPCPNVVGYSIKKFDFTETSASGSNSNVQPTEEDLLADSKDVAYVSSEEFFDYNVTWAANYVYIVTAIYTYGPSLPRFATITLGDSRCENNFGEFCTTEPGQTGQSSVIPTLRAACDSQNRIALPSYSANLPVDCSVLNDLEQNIKYMCTKVDNDKTTCTRLGACSWRSQQAYPVGLFYEEARCYGQNNENYCYYDYSQKLVDACYPCNTGMSCYDYGSQTACEKDRCYSSLKFTKTQVSAGELVSSNLKCKWYPATFAVFGKGFCYDLDYNETSYCSLCNKKNNAFYNYDCPQSVCSRLGSCYSKDGNCLECKASSSIGGGAGNVRSPTICEDYNSEAACEGPRGDLEFNYSVMRFSCEASTAASTAAAGGAVVPVGVGGGAVDLVGSRSSDACHLGVCKWLNNTCFKDGNGNSKDDCINELGYSESGFAAALKLCRRDTAPPEIIPPDNRLPVNKEHTVLEFNSNEDLRSFAFCISKNEKCCPDVVMPFSTFGIQSVSVDFAKYFAGSTAGSARSTESGGLEGGYYVNYYGIDRNLNRADQSSVFFFVDLKPPVISLLYNSTVIDASDSSSPLSSLDVFVNATEPSVCYDSLVYLDGPNAEEEDKGSVIGGVLNTGFSGRYSALQDGFYRYFVSCSDKAGNFVNLTESIRIDAVYLISRVSPSFVVNSQSIDFVVKTADPSDCSVYNGVGNIIVGNLIADSKGLYHELRNVVVAPNKYYPYYYVKCKDRFSDKVDTEHVRFGVDQLPSNTTVVIATVDKVDVFAENNWKAWYNDAITAEFKCSDQLIADLPSDDPIALEKYVFGCNLGSIRYCLVSASSADCTPSTVSSSAVIESNSKLCITSQDNGGNQEPVKCGIVTIDKSPPAINIFSPKTGFATNEYSLVVEGTAYDENIRNITVIVSDSSLAKSQSFLMNYSYNSDIKAYKFGGRISLYPGENFVAAIIYDLAGNSADSVISVIKDESGPKVEVALFENNDFSRMYGASIDHIEHGSSALFVVSAFDAETLSLGQPVNGSFELRKAGVSSSNTSSFSMQIIINSSPLSLARFDFENSGISDIGVPSSNNDFLFYNISQAKGCVNLQNCTLMPGNYSARITVFDRLGNPSVVDKEFVVRNLRAPGLKFLGPGFTRESKPTLRIVSDKIASWCNITYISSGGIIKTLQFALDSSSDPERIYYSVVLDPAIDTSQDNSETPLDIRCADPDGNIGFIDSAKIAYDSVYPVIEDAFVKNTAAFLVNATPIMKHFYLLTTNLTQLVAIASEDVRCKYSGVTYSFSAMEHKFPGFDAVDTPDTGASALASGSFSSDSGFSSTAVSSVFELGDPSENLFYVLCEDRAGNVAQNFRVVKIDVDVNGPIRVVDEYPSGYINNPSPISRAITYKDADCKLRELGSKDSEDLVKVFSQEGLLATGQYIFRSTRSLPVVENKAYFYEVSCIDVNKKLSPGTKLLSFSVDLTPPLIVIKGLDTSSSDALVSASPLLSVNGTTEENATINLYNNGGLEFSAVSYTKNFSTEIALRNGSNSLRIIAVDKAGNEYSLSKEVLYITEGPYVEYIEPNSGIFASLQNITVVFGDRGGGISRDSTIVELVRISNFTGSTSLHSSSSSGSSNGVLIDGVKKGSLTETSVGSSLVISLPPLPEGEYTFKIIPKDKFGLVGEAKIIRFIISTSAPIIELRSPVSEKQGVELLSNNKYMTFSGIVRFAKSYLDHGIIVLNGHVIDITNTFSSSQESLAEFNYKDEVPEARNMFYVEVMDNLGNVGRTQNYYFSIDRTGPVPIFELEDLYGGSLISVLRKFGCGNSFCEYDDHSKSSTDCAKDCIYDRNIADFAYKPAYVFVSSPLPNIMPKNNLGVSYTIKYSQQVLGAAGASGAVREYSVQIGVYQKRDGLKESIEKSYASSTTSVEVDNKKQRVYVFNNNNIIWASGAVVVIISGPDYPAALAQEYLKKYPSDIDVVY